MARSYNVARQPIIVVIVESSFMKSRYLYSVM